MCCRADPESAAALRCCRYRESEVQVLTNASRMTERSCVVMVCWALLSTLVVSESSAQVRRINAPYFPDSVRASEAAVFWFGRVDAARNYTDVRIAYTSTEVWVRLQSFDQWLWLDDAASRTPASLETWDAATVMIDTNGGALDAPSSTSYRFVGGARLVAAAHRLPGSLYGQRHVVEPGAVAELHHRDELAWRCAEQQRTRSRLGDYVSDSLREPRSVRAAGRRHSLAHRSGGIRPGLAVRYGIGPGMARPLRARSAELLGTARIRAATSADAADPPGSETHTLRHGLNGVVVSDAMVGGSSTCGEGLDFFNQWGSANHAHSTRARRPEPG